MTYSSEYMYEIHDRLQNFIFLSGMPVECDFLYPLFQAETYPAMYRSAPADEYLNFPLVE